MGEQTAGTPVKVPVATTDPTYPAAQPPQAGTPKILIALAVLAAGWLVLYGINQLQGIAGPLLLVVNLMIIAYPVQGWLNRRGVPRAVGAVASAVVVFTILLAFVLALVWSVLQMVRILPDYQGEFVALYNSLVEQLERLGVTETQVLDQLRTISPSRIAGWVGTALSSATSTVSWLAIVVTIVFVVIIDSFTLPERFLAAWRSNRSVARSLASFSQGVRRYWVVSSVFGLIVAVIDTIMLMILDVPLFGVWGVLAFLTNFIPNIGFVIGVIPPALMALLAVDARTAILVVVLYSVVNFTIQSIIQPKFSGEAVGVTATVSLLSLMLWTWVLGPLGALLALPATLLAKSLLVDPDPQLLWLNAYLAADPDDVDLPLPRAAVAAAAPEGSDSDGGADEELPAATTARDPGPTPS